MVIAFKMTAHDEAIQGIHLVQQTLLDQEVECPINGRRCSDTALALQIGQDLIGLDDAIILKHQLEDVPTQGGELAASAQAVLLGRVQIALLVHRMKGQRFWNEVIMLLYNTSLHNY